jgi:hypothetical protein
MKTAPENTERLNYRKTSNKIALGLLLIGLINKEQSLLCRFIEPSCNANLDKMVSYILIITLSLFIMNFFQKLVKVSSQNIEFALKIGKRNKIGSVKKIKIKILNFLIVAPVILLAVVGLVYFQEIQNQLAYIMAIVLAARSLKLKIAN